MCKPLRGKKAIKNGQVEFFDLYGDSVKDEFFFKFDVKSAVEGLIKHHEKNIENLIKLYNLENDFDKREQSIADRVFIDRLQLEYDYISLTQSWFEDVIE